MYWLGEYIIQFYKFHVGFWLQKVVRFLKILISLGLVLSLYSFSVKAQNVVTLKPRKTKAAIYKKPNFDAKIIYLLPKGKKVLGTRSTVEGSNGLGLFHKVKLGKSRYGYVLDTEVKISGSKPKSKKKK